MTNTFLANATVLRDFHGMTPYIIGCGNPLVKVLAGWRVMVLEEQHCWSRTMIEGQWIGFFNRNKPYYKVRFAGDNGCFWTVWLGGENNPAIDVLARD